MKRKQMLPLLTLTACLMAFGVVRPFTSDAAPKNNWSQWRGPEGNGVSSETNLPAEWSDTRNIKWKTPIPGRGHSSPVVLARSPERRRANGRCQPMAAR